MGVDRYLHATSSIPLQYRYFWYWLGMLLLLVAFLVVMMTFLLFQTFIT